METNEVELSHGGLARAAFISISWCTTPTWERLLRDGDGTAFQQRWKLMRWRAKSCGIRKTAQQIDRLWGIGPFCSNRHFSLVLLLRKAPFYKDWLFLEGSWCSRCCYSFTDGIVCDSNFKCILRSQEKVFSGQCKVEEILFPYSQASEGWV